jgi:hypothetical protein
MGKGGAEVGKGDGIRTKMEKRKESEMAKGETILCTGGEYYAPSSEGSISYFSGIEGGKVLSGR